MSNTKETYRDFGIQQGADTFHMHENSGKDYVESRDSFDMHAKMHKGGPQISQDELNAFLENNSAQLPESRVLYQKKEEPWDVKLVDKLNYIDYGFIGGGAALAMLGIAGPLGAVLFSGGVVGATTGQAWIGARKRS